MPTTSAATSGLLPDQISCSLKVFEKGRALDDTAPHRSLSERGTGTVTASQISHGRENDLRIEVDGTKAASNAPGRAEQDVDQGQRQPHRLFTRDPNAPFMTDTADVVRLPSGHPEAFLEAFANVYTAAYADIIAVRWQEGGQHA